MWIALKVEWNQISHDNSLVDVSEIDLHNLCIYPHTLEIWNFSWCGNCCTYCLVKGLVLLWKLKLTLSRVGTLFVWTYYAKTFMEGKAPQLDFSCTSAMIEILKYNTPKHFLALRTITSSYYQYIFNATY